ncbi:MAG: hypothetical protein ABI076_04510 [Acidobacteriaceae bacterium]
MRRGLAVLLVVALSAIGAACAGTGKNNSSKTKNKAVAGAPLAASAEHNAKRTQSGEREVPSASATVPPTSAAKFPALTRAAGTPERSPQINRPVLSLKLGGATFTPLGFLDFTSVYRSTNVGSGVGTSFGSIPFNGASPAGRLSELRFSAQNSRIGLKIDADPAANLKVRGYIEADFLGNVPKNLEVASHSNTMRMRLYWVDLRRSRWEFLAGQSWSLMTPNRKGISPMPGDIFYTQNMDTNYQVGLVWLRTPGFRVTFHPNDPWTFALALEDPEQYTGGLVKFPPGFDSSQVDDVGGNAKTPNVAPDIVAKIAYDTSLAGHGLHLEAAGLYRRFRLNTAATNVNISRSGVGGALNLNLDIAKGFHLIGTSFWSDGGGRYIFGLGPDFVVKTDSAGNFIPSPVHAGAGVGGFEYQAIPKTMLYGYYGAAYFGRNFQATSGPLPTFTGFGFPGSSSAQNRAIQEATFGVIETLWKHTGYGDLKIITQAAYLARNPWSNSTTPDGARSAHLGMGYVDLRYDLP